MRTILVHVLLFSLFLQLLQQSSSCSTRALNAYRRCVEDNPCLCSNCDPDPTDDDPEIVLDDAPENCQDVNRIWCPLIRCCSACEEVAWEFYGCAFNDFSENEIGSECPQVCSGFQFSDVEGDCTPTSSPTPAPTVPNPCQNDLDTYNSCVLGEGDAVPQEDVSVLQDGDNCTASCVLEIEAATADDCGNKDIFCPLQECCSKCSTELENAYQCLQSNVLPDGCTLECDVEDNNPVPTTVPNVDAPTREPEPEPQLTPNPSGEATSTESTSGPAPQPSSNSCSMCRVFVWLLLLAAVLVV